MSLASCGPDTPAAPANDAAESPRITDPGPRARTAALPANGPGPSDPSVPPKDAQWTLLVYGERSPTHVSDANGLKEILIHKTKRSDWYVIHSRDESNIYFGYYRAIDEPKAKADLQTVTGIELLNTDGQLETPFKRTAGFVPIAAPDPAAPPEWNLANKDRDKNPKDPTRAYWSLQIMAFKATPMRKEAAVRVVAELRKEGVEAYYYHGETVSSVCVGAWPMSAAQEESPQMIGQDQTPVVYPDQFTNALPKKYDAQGHEIVPTDDQGHELVPVAPRVNITDNSLRQCMKKFYYHSVNGIARVKEGTDQPGVPPVYRDPSFLVVVPRAPGNGPFDSDEVTPADLASGQDPGGYRSQSHPGILGARLQGSPDNAGSVGTDPVPVAPGVGHLRRLGEN